MKDIAVIILTYNEEIHIKRCIESVLSIAKEIFIIDSYSTDKTLEIASAYPNVIELQNKWENNYAKQFNWALENAPITSQWILRLDADEYLTKELSDEILSRMNTIPENISGINLRCKQFFMGKWMKKGIYPLKLMRLFRFGKAHCEQRLMDEHIELYEGITLDFNHDFCNHNLNNLSWFCQKHIGYAVREAADLLNIEYEFTKHMNLNINSTKLNSQALSKRKKKYKYAKSPLFFRAFVYFLYRYFVKGAFLDGKVGFIWTFFQAWWYRTLVDAKIYEIKSECGNDRDKIAEHLRDRYGITFPTETGEQI